VAEAASEPGSAPEVRAAAGKMGSSTAAAEVSTAAAAKVSTAATMASAAVAAAPSPSRQRCTWNHHARERCHEREDSRAEHGHHFSFFAEDARFVHLGDSSYGERNLRSVPSPPEAARNT
jgi:hypothetical protein